MSWHFLQEQEEASWEASCLDGAPCALSSLIPIAAGYCSPDSGTDSCRDSRSGITSPRLTESRGADGSTWSAEDSLAKACRPPTQKEPASTIIEADCGAKWPESLAKFDPVSRSWKTAQCLLGGDSEPFSEIWPRWGIMQDGECWALTAPVFRSSGSECGLWPSPTAGSSKTNRIDFSKWGGSVARKKIQTMLPRDEWFAVPNPDWVESFLMGWPERWTEIEPLATDKFQQWCDSHGISWEAQDDLP